MANKTANMPAHTGSVKNVQLLGENRNTKVQIKLMLYCSVTRISQTLMAFMYYNFF